MFWMREKSAGIESVVDEQKRMNAFVIDCERKSVRPDREVLS